MSLRDQRITAYIPEDLRDRLEAFRIRYQMSLSNAVRHLLQRGLDAEENRDDGE